MKVGIIARRTTGQPLGVARLTQYLVKSMATMLQTPDGDRPSWRDS